MNKKTIALIASSKNAYSQTFVQAHKKYFYANVKYYYNGMPPNSLEGVGLMKPSLYTLFKFFIRYYILKCEIKAFNEFVLISSFKKNKIEKVYAEFGPVAVSILSTCKKLKIPLIVNFHGYDISRHEIMDSYREKYKEMISYAESIVIVAKYMKNTLIKLGADEKKIFYTPCAPNDIFFEIKPKYEGNYFVSIGRFVNKKAPYYTILAFKKVCEKFPEAKLYFAGDGELHNACKNIIKYFKLERNIILLGVITPNDLIKLYENALGFIQHSITADDGDMEGTPVSVLEASASGLPVIATMHAGIQDIVIDNKTGLLVDEHDVDGMVENIKKLLMDKEHAKLLGRNGREYVKNNFSMKKHIDLLNKLINK